MKRYTPMLASAWLLALAPLGAQAAPPAAPPASSPPTAAAAHADGAATAQAPLGAADATSPAPMDLLAAFISSKFETVLNSTPYCPPETLQFRICSRSTFRK